MPNDQDMPLRTGRFTAEEDAQLREFCATNASWAEIAAAMNRVQDSCQNRMTTLKIRRVNVKNGSPPGFVPPAKLAEMEARKPRVLVLVKQGKSFTQIVEATGFPRKWIRIELARLRSEGVFVFEDRGRSTGMSLSFSGHRYNSNPKPGWVESRDAALEAHHRRAEHTRRMLAAPPLDADDAERLIRDAMAAGRVTLCPPRAVAAVNNGAGFLPAPSLAHMAGSPA